MNETMPLRFSRLSDAFALAAELHNAQTRKGTDIPYLSHLMSVSAIVLENGGDEDQAIAALLHDAVEDQGGLPTLDLIARRFGSGVAEIVSDCTDAWDDPKPPWRARKEAYLRTLPTKSSRSLLVGMADKIHNAESIVSDAAAVGAVVWGRFNGGYDGTLWYFKSLLEVFAAQIPGSLCNRLARAVQAMEKS